MLIKNLYLNQQFNYLLRCDQTYKNTIITCVISSSYVKNLSGDLNYPETTTIQSQTADLLVSPFVANT